MNQYLILSVILFALVTLIFINRSAFTPKNPKNNLQFSSASPQPSVTEFVSPILSPQPTNQLLTEFKYPNSEQLSNNNNLVLNSTDNPQVITDWYKNEITAKGFTTTSFVQTNTNGEILNKLVGSNGNKEVRVEISKEANNPAVVIKIASNG